MTTAKEHIPSIPPLPGMVCFACNASVTFSANFCPNCGRQLRTRRLATSVSKHVIVYLVSFFLAPLGLWYAWKYLKQDDKKSKQIGIMAIALTIISVVGTIWATAGLFNSVTQVLKSLSGLGL